MTSFSSNTNVYENFIVPKIQCSISEFNEKFNKEMNETKTKVLNEKEEKAALKKQKRKEYNAKRYANQKALKQKQEAAKEKNKVYEQKLLARCQEHPSVKARFQEHQEKSKQAKATEQRAKAKDADSSHLRLRQIRARRALIAAEDLQLRKEEDIEYAYVFDKPFVL